MTIVMVGMKAERNKEAEKSDDAKTLICFSFSVLNLVIIRKRGRQARLLITKTLEVFTFL